MSERTPIASYRVTSPAGGAGGGAGASAAIAIVELLGEIEPLLSRLGVAPVRTGCTGLREIPGVDTVVIAQNEPRAALLFPHAGPAVLQRVVRALEAAGAVAASMSPSEAAGDPRLLLAERLHAALARAASPLAIDLLLDQPRRWQAVWQPQPGASAELSELDAETSRVLNRLIEPALVIAIGPPNVGKSSLLNALAGRSVSIVADEPGTTRDHVGVLVNFAGVVARVVDAPGIERSPSDDIQREAQEIALRLAADADLVLLCGDRTSDPLDPTTVPIGRGRALRIATRCDLGRPSSAFDIAVSSRTGEGLEPLVAAIRESLIPEAALALAGAWRFW